MFPQVYISPHSSLPYLTGRTLASFVTSTLTVIVSLILSFYILSSVFHTNIPFIVTPVSISLLFLAMVMNIFAALGLGLLLSAYALFATKFEWALPTYVGNPRRHHRPGIGAPCVQVRREPSETARCHRQKDSLIPNVSSNVVFWLLPRRRLSIHRPCSLSDTSAARLYPRVPTPYPFSWRGYPRETSTGLET